MNCRAQLLRACPGSIVVLATVLALVVPPTAARAQDLFAYWPLEEVDPAEPAEDFGPNGIEGTLLPGVDPDVDGALGFGSGAAFDGTVDGSIDLGVDNALGTLMSDFTIVAWMYPTDLTGKNRIIGSLQPNGWGFGPVGNNILEVTTFGVKDYRVTYDFVENEWVHVAVVLDENADATFYVDGVMIGTDPAGGPARPSFDNFYLGRASSAAEYFTGRLDEIAVFEGSLNEDEIIEIMEEGVDVVERQCTVRRSVSPEIRDAGATVDVSLSARSIPDATTITETIPDGWTITDAGGGTVNGNTIAFSVAAGDTIVSYQVKSPDGVCEDGTFSGSVAGPGTCSGDVRGETVVGCSCSVVRTVAPESFEPGQTIEVTLAAANITGATTITETIPDGWTVTNAGGGTVAGNTIRFSVDADADHVYELAPPDDFCGDVTLSGSYSGAGNCDGDVSGVTQVSCSLVELFAYWPLEEEDPEDPAEDLGPNGIDGAYLIGVTPGEDGAPGFGGGAMFDGTIDGSIDLGADNPLGELLSDFSIVAWMYPTDLTGKNRIIGSLQPNGWGFGPVESNILEVTTFGVKDYRVNVDFLQEEWTHVAVVLDENADATFYVNGELIGTDPAGGPARPSFDNFYLGRAASSAEYFTGFLDEIAVFSGSLTQDQIIDIMEEGVLPEPEPTEPEFRRGDVNVDGRVDLSDGVNTLNFLFSGGADPSCADASDTDDDGNIAINDAVGVFNSLFAGGADPAPPGPQNCGVDPTEDPLTCMNYPACP